MINLSEIFFSIQGESSFAGFPCIFIRFAGCNLRCNYCDTKFAYETEFSMEISEIMKTIDKYSPVKLVEITGGEPLLQPQIYDLISALLKKKYRILLETNGSVNLQKVPAEVIKIVDVKCPGSGEGNSFLMENLKFLNPSDEIKFVLSDRNDYDWAKNFVERYKLNGRKILFSPVFGKVNPAELAKWILQDKLPVRMQLQLQKYIWNPKKRGV